MADIYGIGPSGHVTKMSRQREYQKRMREKGLCILCGEKAAPSRRKGQITSAFCVVHLLANRERNRIKYGRKLRYTHSASYQLKENEV